jgi:hypothetical protein
MMPVFQHDFKDFRARYTESKGYLNTVFDVHVYQVFGDPHAGWRNMSLAQHLRYATASRIKEHDAKCIADHGERVVVSEFSLAMPTWHTDSMISREHEDLSDSEKVLLRRCFAFRQLRTFASLTEGCFFWSWKDDAGAEWSLAHSSAQTWMPSFCQNSKDAEFSRESVPCPPSQKRKRFSTTPAWEDDAAEGFALEASELPIAKRPRFDSDASTDVGQSSDYESEDPVEQDAVADDMVWELKMAHCSSARHKHDCTHSDQFQCM